MTAARTIQLAWKRYVATKREKVLKVKYSNDGSNWNRQMALVSSKVFNIWGLSLNPLSFKWIFVPIVQNLPANEQTFKFQILRVLWTIYIEEILSNRLFFLKIGVVHFER